MTKRVGTAIRVAVYTALVIIGVWAVMTQRASWWMVVWMVVSTYLVGQTFQRSPRVSDVCPRCRRPIQPHSDSEYPSNW